MFFIFLLKPGNDFFQLDLLKLENIIEIVKND